MVVLTQDTNSVCVSVLCKDISGLENVNCLAQRRYALYRMPVLVSNCANWTRLVMTGYDWSRFAFVTTSKYPFIAPNDVAKFNYFSHKNYVSIFTP